MEAAVAYSDRSGSGWREANADVMLTQCSDTTVASLVAVSLGVCPQPKKSRVYEGIFQ